MHIFHSTACARACCRPLHSCVNVCSELPMNSNHARTAALLKRTTPKLISNRIYIDDSSLTMQISHTVSVACRYEDIDRRAAGLCEARSSCRGRAYISRWIVKRAQVGLGIMYAHLFFSSAGSSGVYEKLRCWRKG